jgi:hypothetical protein
MGERWSVDGPRVLEVGSPETPVREVRLRLVSGRVDVVASDDTDGAATVEVASVRGRPLEISWSENGVLDVGHPQLTWDTLLDRLKAAFPRDGGAEVSVAVPREVAVRLGTVGADGLVSGIRGAADVRTVSGTLVLDGVRGKVSARTVSGRIDVRDHEGPFHGDSVSGSLTVQGGSIPRLHGKTVSGEVGVDLRRPPAVLDVTTVSGDVTVRVPAGTGYDLTAKSVSGRVVAGSSQITGSPGSRNGHLREGDGAVKLVARTVSGDVTLVRAASTPA